MPTCGLTALLSASAIQQWYMPGLPVELVACALVLFFVGVNMCSVRWIAGSRFPIATGSAALAFLSSFVPILTGSVDWRTATGFLVDDALRRLVRRRDLGDGRPFI